MSIGDVKGVKQSGEVKYSGIESGSIQWKTGAIEITNQSGRWMCNLYFNSNSDICPVRSYEISAPKIDQVIFKSRLLIQLKNKIHIHFRPKSVSHMVTLKKILEEIQGSESDENSLLRTPEKQFKRTSTPNKTVPLLFNGSTSPVTDLTNSIKSDKIKVQDIENSLHEESKENQYSGPSEPVTPDQFLKRGTEKSREKLKSLSTGGFYSGSKTTESPLFTSYKSSKRSLGFLPDPTPNKKFRLSDCTYSWSKNKSSPVIENTKSSSLQGFSNLGNTCYMNATLQSLYGLDPFSTDLLHTHTQVQKSLSTNSLYYNLTRLLKARKYTGLSDSTRRELLRNVKRAISTSAKRFSGYQQHDAHEFLGQVLDQLKEEVMKVEKSEGREITLSPETNNNQSSTIINPTVQNFEFEVLHKIQCVDCGEEIEKLENFNDLSIDLPKKLMTYNGSSIQDALNVFLDEEEIEYTCSKCHHNRSVVSHQFSTLPRILVLQLKRNSFDIRSSRNGKVVRSIQIPKTLSLSYFCNDETVPCPPPPPLHNNYRFKRRSCSLDSSLRQDDDPIQLSNGDWDDVMKNKKEEDDIAKAIELSLKQQKHTEGETSLETEEDQLQKALEMSLKDDQHKTTFELSEYCSNNELAKLTEEERIDLAIQESLKQAEQEYELQLNGDASKIKIQSPRDLLDEVDLHCSEDKENLFDDDNVTENNCDIQVYDPDKFEAEYDYPFSEYRLVSIVNHIGSSSELGHYMTDVYDIKKQCWLCYNDSRVTELSESDVCCRREKSGYIFFYMNKYVFDELKDMINATSIS